MGVKGLWRLLLPIGRRISIETLEGQILAVDASIWLTQFVKAMRDPDTGSVTPAAHLIGFLRRICKLRFHGIRPVFVFDGATPEIKKRELALRRRRREALFPNTGDSDDAIQRMAKRLLSQQLQLRNKKKLSKQAIRDAKSKKKTTTTSAAQGFYDPEEEAANHNNESEAEDDDDRTPAARPNESIDHLEEVTDLSDTEDYLQENETSAPDEAQSPSDWDLNHDDHNDFTDVDTEQQQQEEQEAIEQSILSSMTNDFDVDYVARLSSDQRKDWVEQAQRSQRMQSRQEFLKVAANPQGLSQCQLRNFLRSTQLNKNIAKMAVKVAQEKGIDTLTTDGSRRIMFEKDDDGTSSDKNAHRDGGSSSARLFEEQGDSQVFNLARKRSPRKARRRSHAASESNSDEDDDDVDWEDGNINASGSNTRSGRAILDDEDDEVQEAEGGFLRPSDLEKMDESADKKSAHVDGTNFGGGGFMTATQKYPDPGSGSGPAEHDGGFLRQSESINPHRKPQILFEKDAEGVELEEKESQEAKDAKLAQELQDEILAAELQRNESEGGDMLESRPSDDVFGLSNKEKRLVISSSLTKQKEDESYDSSVGSSDDDQASSVHSHDPTPGTRKPALSLVGIASMVPGSSHQDSNSESEEEDPQLAWAMRESMKVNHSGGKAPVHEKGNGLITREIDGSDISRPILLDMDSHDQPAQTHTIDAKAKDGTGTTLGLKHVNNPITLDDSDENEDASDVDWEDGDEEHTDDSPPKENVVAQHQDTRRSDKRGNCSSTDEGVREHVDGSQALEKKIQGAVAPEPQDNVETFNDDRSDSSVDSNGAFQSDEESWGHKRNSQDAETAAALEHAQATAARLTNWAGRAFRQAIAKHTEQTGSPSKSQSSPTVKKASQGPQVGQAIRPASDSSVSVASVGATLASRDDEPLKPLQNIAPGTSPLLSNSTATTNREVSQSHQDPGASESTRSVDLEHLQQEEWTNQRNQEERDMDGVTDEMKSEAMQLLSLFGIPYMEAPAEAEAQCCALEKLGLVHGVVTEDSDAFVFGGQKVYKNIFDDQKYVEAYYSKDAEREMNLTYDAMVALAMLLGGDYTEGVKGVGIVNGMEVIDAFDVSKNLRAGLKEFRKWLDGFDPNEAIGKGPDESTLTKGQVFSRNHRAARTRWVAPKNFPSEKVISAYTNPVVDKSNEKFSWGTPDLTKLEHFFGRHAGWTSQQTRSMVEPVIERLKDSSRQTRIDSYMMKYEDGIKFANVHSKRLRTVLSKHSNDFSATIDPPRKSIVAGGTSPHFERKKYVENENSNKRPNGGAEIAPRKKAKVTGSRNDPLVQDEPPPVAEKPRAKPRQKLKLKSLLSSAAQTEKLMDSTVPEQNPDLSNLKPNPKRKLPKNLPALPSYKDIAPAASSTGDNVNEKRTEGKTTGPAYQESAPSYSA